MFILVFPYLILFYFWSDKINYFVWRWCWKKVNAFFKHSVCWSRWKIRSWMFHVYVGLFLFYFCSDKIQTWAWLAVDLRKQTCGSHAEVIVILLSLIILTRVHTSGEETSFGITHVLDHPLLLHFLIILSGDEVPGTGF